MSGKKRNNRNSQSSTQTESERIEASKRRYNRRMKHIATRQKRYADREFAIWAEDSWGSDDPDVGGRRSVHSHSGGRVQSNRSRY